MVEELPVLPELVFDEEQHAYTKDGDSFLGATTFIGLFFPVFNAWKIIQSIEDKPKYDGMSGYAIKKSWENISSDGTFVHDALENYIKGGTEVSHVKVDAGKQYWDEWVQSHDVVDVVPELRLYCDDGVAGTADVPMIVKDGKGRNCISIVDWKTNKKLSDYAYGKTGVHRATEHLEASKLQKYELQLSLYAYMLQQHTGLPVEDLRIVWLKQDGSYKEFDLVYRKNVVKHMLQSVDWAKKELERRKHALRISELRYDYEQTKKFINDETINSIVKKVQSIIEEELRVMKDEDYAVKGAKGLTTNRDKHIFAGMVFNNIEQEDLEDVEAYVKKALSVRAKTLEVIEELQDV